MGSLSRLSKLSHPTTSPALEPSRFWFRRVPESPPVLQGATRGQRGHVSHSIVKQAACRDAERRSRGHDVIDEKYVYPAWGRFGPPSTRSRPKGAPEVRSPVAAGQTGLRTRRPGSSQEMPEGAIREASQGPGDLLGLVVATRDPPAPVEGNRGDDVDGGEIRGEPVVEDPGELSSQVVETTEFEAMYHPVERRFVAPAAQQPAPWRRVAAARKTQTLSRRGIRRQITTAPGAAFTGRRTEGAETPRAEAQQELSGRIQIVTSEADRRQDEVENRPEPPGRRS